MSFVKFIKSKTFLWQLLLGFVAIVVVLFVAFQSLSLYTLHGRTITVPNFEGFCEAEVAKHIENVGLQYVIIDSVYRPDADPGVIIDQIPAAGQQVKKDRKIFFTINAFSREMVTMPQLVDFSLRNAQVVLESVGLKLGLVTYKPSAFSDLVLGQMMAGKPIAKGTKIPRGAEIELIVGNGRGGNSVVVPEVIGLSRADALQAIKNANLTQGSLLFDETILSVTDSATAVVYKQQPEARNNATEPAGTPVNMWLTNDMEKIVSALAATQPEE